MLLCNAFPVFFNVHTRKTDFLECVGQAWVQDYCKLGRLRLNSHASTDLVV